MTKYLSSQWFYLEMMIETSLIRFDGEEEKIFQIKYVYILHGAN